MPTVGIGYQGGVKPTGETEYQGVVPYPEREYCQDVRCPLQLELDAGTPGAEGYERIRTVCQTDCRHTAYEFHHWLSDKGYLIVRPEQSPSVQP
jgi:hypothetical protein